MIVEYIDCDKYSKETTLNPYKHNGEIDVKVRVFNLLETIFERPKQTILSFLVIDVKTGLFK